MNADINYKLPYKYIPLPEWAASERPPHADIAQRRYRILSRVIEFDPSPVYERVANGFDYYRRLSRAGLETIFPPRNDGICACGCDATLAGRRNRWATDECRDYGFAVSEVFAGVLDWVRMAVCFYHFGDWHIWGCVECGKMGCMEIDHVVPVHKGGGACWLSNYRPLCVDCHKAKTKLDRSKI